MQRILTLIITIIPLAGFTQNIINNEQVQVNLSNANAFNPVNPINDLNSFENVVQLANNVDWDNNVGNQVQVFNPQVNYIQQGNITQQKFTTNKPVGGMSSSRSGGSKVVKNKSGLKGFFHNMRKSFQKTFSNKGKRKHHKSRCSSWKGRV